jgi:DNA-binding NtrC family response regulator
MLPETLNSSATILVVDDEEFLLQYVRLVLARAGYSVFTARNGEEAWHLLAEGGHEIRLLLTDIVMPGSFDGFQLAGRVHKRHPDLPVLFMTGALPQEHPYADVFAWRKALLRKPFYPDQLLAIVRENLEAASQSV